MERQELENALKTKDIQIKSKDGKIKILEMDILNLKKQLQEIKENLQNKENKIVIMENKTALDGTSTKKYDGLSSMNDLVQDLQLKIRKQKSQIEKLTKQLEQSSVGGGGYTDSSEIIQPVKTIQVSTMKDKKEIQALRDNIELLEKEISKLKNTKSNEFYELQKNINETESDKSQLETQLMTKDNEIESLREQLAQKETISQNKEVPLQELIDDLRRNNDRLRAQNKKLREETDQKLAMKEPVPIVTEHDKKIDELEKAKNILKEKLWKLSPEPEQKEQKADANELSKEIESLKKENQGLQEKISILSQGPGNDQIKINEMKSLIEILKNRTKQQKLEIENLKKRLG
jgi:chromosome segregation ATPase